MRKLLSLSLLLALAIPTSSARNNSSYHDYQPYEREVLQRGSIRKTSTIGIIVRVVLSSILSVAILYSISDVCMWKGWDAKIIRKISSWINWTSENTMVDYYKNMWIFRLVAIPLFLLLNSVICYLIFETFGAHPSEEEQKDQYSYSY